MEGVRHWWDNGKIRLSYGALGNQQVSNYLYLQTIGTGTLNYLFDDSGKASYASVSDPMSSNLTWETVYTYNLGLDLSCKTAFRSQAISSSATRRTCSRSR